MSALINVRIDPDEGESYVVAVTTRDLLMWERTGGPRASAGRLTKEQRATDVYAVAYCAARRLGKFAGTLPEFEASCDFEMVTVDDESEEPGEADPTNPAQ